jgi:hypothetical protein
MTPPVNVPSNLLLVQLSYKKCDFFLESIYI